MEILLFAMECLKQFKGGTLGGRSLNPKENANRESDTCSLTSRETETGRASVIVEFNLFPHPFDLLVQSFAIAGKVKDIFGKLVANALAARSQIRTAE
jgi:hypothetical protein